ncbi:MAG: hypothetical protein KDA61_21650, partial [Planctomycetales bacterium]|nr:hypothetical protein [Planctomycetales bacterium]
DRAISAAEVLRRDGAAHIAILDGAVENLVRRYRLGSGEANPWGRQTPLPLPSARKTPWCGLKQDARNLLVVADPERPQLSCYELTDAGWGVEASYPSAANVIALAAPQAQPGVVLIWAKGENDLLRSEWKNDRLTYPEPWSQASDSPRKIIALGTSGDVTWWVQSVKRRLDFYRWPAGASEPAAVQFEDIGTKAEEALWIGVNRLLVKEQHARELKVATLADDGSAKLETNPALKSADLGDFRLVAENLADGTTRFRLGRLTEGVMQWLDEDLQSIDQTMLPQGEQLSDYLADGPDAGWALQRNAPFVHRMERADSGLLQSTARWTLRGAETFVRDPLLGLLAIRHDAIVHIAEGATQQLELIDLADRRIARSEGVRDAYAHRLEAVDLDADGTDELVLLDDLHHRLTALALAQDELKTLISWPVFDDNKYPYEDTAENLVREPRAVVSLDFDGDDRPDLALLCHDRLILYLGGSQP